MTFLDGIEQININKTLKRQDENSAFLFGRIIYLENLKQNFRISR